MKSFYVLVAVMASFAMAMPAESENLQVSNVATKVAPALLDRVPYVQYVLKSSEITISNLIQTAMLHREYLINLQVQRAKLILDRTVA
ncbi:hypothetical protein NLG97_g2797 [Lecanicillium saksenae]|uniref:Uncharacterized protein n=1 Tax=Lecanicillium saksenae TaxID=468837 RepID=A0ACC1R1C7_9HYPO|nr:hypothetical protein NLG97_g2797 [Lecanicillium saksenae]